MRYLLAIVASVAIAALGMFALGSGALHADCGSPTGECSYPPTTEQVLGAALLILALLVLMVTTVAALRSRRRPRDIG